MTSRRQNQNNYDVTPPVTSLVTSSCGEARVSAAILLHLASARLDCLPSSTPQKTALEYAAGRYKGGISLLLQDSRNCSLEHSSILLSLRQRDIPMASEIPPRQKTVPPSPFLPREEKRSFPVRPSSRNQARQTAPVIRLLS